MRGRMGAEMDAIQKNLLEKITELHEVTQGAYNIRANGASVERNSTAHIDIVSKEDKQGIDIVNPTARHN